LPVPIINAAGAGARTDAGAVKAEKPEPFFIQRHAAPQHGFKLSALIFYHNVPVFPDIKTSSDGGH